MAGKMAETLRRSGTMAATKSRKAAQKKADYLGDAQQHSSVKIRIMSFVLVVASAIMLFITLAQSSALVATAASLLFIFIGALAAVHSELYAKGGIFLSLWAIQYVVASFSAWNPLLLLLFAGMDAFLAWLLFIRRA